MGLQGGVTIVAELTKYEEEGVMNSDHDLINPLALEMDIEIVAHHLCKM